MLIMGWTSIIETEAVPPLGFELAAHLNKLHGSVKNASCSAWNLLYQVLLDNDLPIGIVSFTKTGKPYFIDSNLHFSLSHSKGICAVAISYCSVGVDIEICKKSYNHYLIDRSITDAEKVAYDGDFTRIWCRKEAVAKMTGEGIIGFPNNIDTTSYSFSEQQIEQDGMMYWLVAVEGDKK